MNWDQVKGKWHQFKGSVRAKWGDITDDEIEQMDGNREKKGRQNPGEARHREGRGRASGRRMDPLLQLIRSVRAAASKRLAATVVAALILPACADIWNASDLALWVRDRAVAEGCQRETVELDDWYTLEAGHNVWHGTCRDGQGNDKAFGINVDPVWTSSRSQP
jgi:uncharacterized protein YjbJ (UPF0337 family)